MKKLTALSALAGFMLFGCGVFYTIDTAAPKAGGGTPLELSAWLVSWDAESMKSFEANLGALARVYPEYITCGDDGLPGKIDIIKDGWIQGVVALARPKGVKVLITMNNYANGGFDAARVRKFLQSPSLMAAHVESLIQMAKEAGVDGLDVDYESLESADRSGFTAFVAALGKRCKAEGLLLGIAVHPKESEPGNWGGPMAQDYAALGSVVDFFHVMTYDYHWATSDAGSIAPPIWFRSVGNFTLSQVPASKLEMGINSYGYSWAGKQGETMTWPAWERLLKAGHRAERDPNTQELVMHYGGREAWYPDAKAYAPKLEAARELGVRGCAMWVLGQEDPAFWKAWEKQRKP